LPGAQGATGLTGPRGQAGESNIPGPPGLTGPPGPSGDFPTIGSPDFIAAIAGIASDLLGLGVEVGPPGPPGPSGAGGEFPEQGTEEFQQIIDAISGGLPEIAPGPGAEPPAGSINVPPLPPSPGDLNVPPFPSRTRPIFPSRGAFPGAGIPSGGTPPAPGATRTVGRLSDSLRVLSGLLSARQRAASQRRAFNAARRAAAARDRRRADAINQQLRVLAALRQLQLRRQPMSFGQSFSNLSSLGLMPARSTSSGNGDWWTSTTDFLGQVGSNILGGLFGTPEPLNGGWGEEAGVPCEFTPQGCPPAQRPRQQTMEAGLDPRAMLALAQQAARVAAPIGRRALQLVGAGGAFGAGEEGVSRLMANDVTFDPSGQPGMACGLFRPRAGGAMARTSIRPSPIIVIPNPETGKPTFFLHAGEPDGWSKWTKKKRRSRKR